MNTDKCGLLIVVEGIDGAGKSTQVARLAEALRQLGMRVTTSREPTDGPWGKKIRASATTGRMTLEDELNAFVEDRKEHVAQVIRPALKRGEIVLLDRYYFSTIAYQGARGGDVAAIRAANEAIAPKPDMVLLIDFDPEAALHRIRGSRGDVPDEFEKLDQLREIRRLFLAEAAADPSRFRIIDGGREPDLVFRDLRFATQSVCDEFKPSPATTNSPPQEFVLDFSNVSGEIQSITARRRELMVFLGSLFAAMGLLLQRILGGELPAALKPIETSAFFTHSLLVLIPTIIIALRIAKLHGGLVINGVFYARAVRDLASLTEPPPSPYQVSRLNVLGMSASLYWLASFLAGGEAAVLSLSLHFPVEIAIATGVGCFAAMAIMLAAMHIRAARFALSLVERCGVEPFNDDEHEKHLLNSRNETNRDLISTTGFAGLMLFSTLECMTGLGSVRMLMFDINPENVLRYGPIAYNIVMLVTCVSCMLIYMRLAVAIGDFSLKLDPTDRPFRPFKFTDTLLGYMLLVFFWVVAVHLLAFTLLGPNNVRLWYVDGIAGAIALTAYPARIAYVGRKRRR